MAKLLQYHGPDNGIGFLQVEFGPKIVIHLQEGQGFLDASRRIRGKIIEYYKMEFSSPKASTKRLIFS